MNAAFDHARVMDRMDPLAHMRERFDIPDEMIYLDGNSLGAVPRGVAARLEQTIKSEWGEGLIRSWAAKWINMPISVGDKIARLIGAGVGEIVVGDSTSVNLFKCLAAALAARPQRRVILAEKDNFPTDNYIVQGLASLLGNVEIRYFLPDEGPETYLDEDVAVTVLSHVDYRTSRVLDMRALNDAAHAVGSLVLWDLSHSTGAVRVDLSKAEADFAVGCSYKYLNGGPGAPAFLWVNPRLVGDTQQPLSGWMGHANPFAFEQKYEPGIAIRRFVSGTPQILSLSALDESLDLWADVDMNALFEKSFAMTELFIELVEETCGAHGLQLRSPRERNRRGSHVSFDLDIGYPVMRALAARGVIGDFRAPSTMRFGFAPLYLRFTDIVQAVSILHEILETRSWDGEEYHARSTVT